ncbi:MAG: Rne/Rng family ribonuclease [Candidatus Cloacimonetes bacterium]|jgi:ribonuclease G|nr:Rne/Rng family ribonuclease [Candidatus Cloacimonadota bacterium]MDD4156026.1 Rne/Rng family ribonuclease [Candidatus Cloacimonadota bacterium]
MFTEIILNIQPREKRMALMEDHQLVELFVEKGSNNNIVGNIYKGIVKDVLPGLGAAFIDIGHDRTAFLHYTDIVSDFLDDADDDENTEQNNKFLAQDSHKITEVLKPNQEIIVQIQKGPIGNKGARLIGQISLPGKLLVFFPHQEKIAVSRKINSYQEKNRIKTILQNIIDPNIGIIVRTEAENCSEEELIEEYKLLYKQWKFLEKKIENSKAPTCIFDENDLMSTIVRDIFTSKVDRLIVDNRDYFNQITHRLKEYNPELSERCELYLEDSPIFDTYNIEKEIEKIFFSRIYLPSGGNIVIEQTEALVTIDVNTGSYTGKNNYEQTIKLTNIEAAKEIARQVRLRNLSGILIIDFIDMQHDQSKQEVLDQLKQAFKKDRAKNRVYPFGPLGLVEVTRKRTRTTLMQTYFEHCPHCHGTGRVLSRNSLIFKINRWLQRAEYFIKCKPLEIFVPSSVKQSYDENPDILTKTCNPVKIIEDKSLDHNQYKIILTEEGKDITAKYNS